MSRAAGDPGDGSARIPALDGVRGLAIFIVIVHNAGWIAGTSEVLPVKMVNALTASGWVGVQPFFALSGFLITGILLQTKGREGYFRSFYLRRALRIFPLYYAFVACVVLLAPVIAWSPEWAEAVRERHWPYWFYLSNWVEPFRPGILGLPHLWSLAVEEQFYLVWPVVVLALTRRGLIRFSVAVLLLTPLLRLGLRLADLPALTAYLFTIARWDAIVAGALVAVLVTDPPGREFLARWQGRAAAFAFLALLCLVGVQRGFNSDEVPVQVLGQSLITVLCAALIAYAVQAGPAADARLQAALSARWLRTLGKYSYAMYIFHFPIQQLLTPLLQDVVQGNDNVWRIGRLALYEGLVFGLTFAAALLSWRLIEQPALRLKERIAPRPA